MEEITPTGWLIDDGGAWQFTTKSEDLAVAKRFNWKVTPLYSKQSLADIRAEAVMDAAKNIRSEVMANECYYTVFAGKPLIPISIIEEYANKLKGGE